MAGVFQHKYDWRKVAIPNVLLALVLPFLHALFGTGVTWRDLARDFSTSLVYAFCIGSLAHLVMPNLWGWTRHRRPAVRIPAAAFALISIAAISTFVATGILVRAGYYPEGQFWKYYVLGFKVGAVITLVFGACITTYKTMKAQLDETTLELRTKELERERALKLATEARLSSLESRIHPHFLFNTLNSISSLIQEDPKTAERLIERMSALLRFSLDSGQTGVVPLCQEIKIVRDYLEIEHARFGDRLRFDVQIPSELDRLEVPPLSIQTLVENSVKYAVSTRRKGGIIRVSAVQNGDRIELEVWDDGPGFEIDAVIAGHGIDNLQARLLTTFGIDAALGLRRADAGMSVFISMPQLALK